MYGLATTLLLLSLGLNGAAGAPQPRPAGSLETRELYQPKQANRRQVVNRLQNPPQRRTSPPVYPHCANASPNYNAAVYPGIQTASNEPADYINNVPAGSFDACIEICRNTAGTSHPVRPLALLPDSCSGCVRLMLHMYQLQVTVR